jgi:hypothetical protein
LEDYFDYFSVSMSSRLSGGAAKDLHKDAQQYVLSQASLAER